MRADATRICRHGGNSRAPDLCCTVDGFIGATQVDRCTVNIRTRTDGQSTCAFITRSVGLEVGTEAIRTGSADDRRSRSNNEVSAGRYVDGRVGCSTRDTAQRQTSEAVKVDAARLIGRTDDDVLLSRVRVVRELDAVGTRADGAGGVHRHRRASGADLGRCIVRSRRRDAAGTGRQTDNAAIPVQCRAGVRAIVEDNLASAVRRLNHGRRCACRGCRSRGGESDVAGLRSVAERDRAGRGRGDAAQFRVGEVDASDGRVDSAEAHGP